MRAFITTIIITMFFAVSAAAQSSKTIVFIDSSKFYDKTNGIQRLVLVNTMLESTDTKYSKRRYEIRVAAENLRREIDDLKSKNLPVEDQRERLRKLNDEDERMKTLVDEIFKKQEGILLKPVMNDINEAIKDFAIRRKYLIVDLIETSLVSHTENVPNVTSDFIKFCNELFEQRNRKNN